MKKDEYGRIGFGPVSTSSSCSSWAAARAAASAALSNANSAALMGSLKFRKKLVQSSVGPFRNRTRMIIKLILMIITFLLPPARQLPLPQHSGLF